MNILDQIKNQKGAKFVSIRGYESSKKEVSNQTILVGANYGNIVKRDIEKLENAHFSNKDMEDVRVEMLAKMIANQAKEGKESNQSKAQSDAYSHICDGIRYHVESGSFKINGYSINKKVLVKGEYKSTNKRAKTILQDSIKKELNLMTAKYRQFTLGGMNEVAMDGKVLSLNFDGSAFTPQDKNVETKMIVKITIEYSI